jgi:DUF438 domain-containing protein
MSEYTNNSAARKETLKQLIRELHAGGDPRAIRARFRALVGQVSAAEIAQLEQELIDDGLPVAEVQRLCDVHVAIFGEGLEGEAAPEMTPGHPVHTFKYENFAANEAISLVAAALGELPASAAWERAWVHAAQLAEIDKIYLRKENLLFPILERHGVSGPSAVMWATHDQIRAGLKAFRAALEAGDAAAARAQWEPLAGAIRAMFTKEEQILYPTALKVLSEAEWVAIRDGSDEIGYCLIRPGNQWQPTAVPAIAQPTAAVAAGELTLDTGVLTAEQVNLLLTHLPVDVTFIDEHDTVRYFSQGPDRIFVRTAAIIGRKVQNCHPPQSVAIVNRLLEELKSGARDSAEFWIQMGAKFVYIRYLAVRDGQGRYRGTLEMTQEISGLRALEGERHLLDVERPTA